jgi:hypothetical protein
MITCSSIGYNGRLANQIFQFSSTVGVARNLGYDAIFPIENFINGNPHSYDGGKLLDCFDIPSIYFLPADQIRGEIKYQYLEKDISYDVSLESIPDFVDLRGYFQTEKYFIESEEEIRKCLSFKESVKSKGESIIDIPENSVSIHVRRGDYTQFLDHHPTQKMEYYINSMNDFVGIPKFIFSDDIEWCRNNFKSTGDDSNIFLVDCEDPFCSLYLMSKCKNHIIANSSFSWWGAWLSGSRGKVIAPSVWFGNSIKKETKDIYCKSWKII